MSKSRGKASGRSGSANVKDTVNVLSSATPLMSSSMVFAGRPSTVRVAGGMEPLRSTPSHRTYLFARAWRLVRRRHVISLEVILVVRRENVRKATHRALHDAAQAVESYRFWR